MQSPPLLEQLYWLSQIFLLLVAFGAAIVAYIQIQTFKRFEIFKFIEQPHIREARACVFRRIKLAKEDWRKSEALQDAAALVCASYDILGIVAGWWNRRFFARHWGYSICWTYEALDDFLKDRRKSFPDAYRGYKCLYDQAKHAYGQGMATSETKD